MKRNPASDASRQAFAALFAKLMLDGANSKGEQRKRWTDEALAEALDHLTKRTDKNVAPNAIANWRKAKFLPLDVEPLITVFFGTPPADRKAAEAFRRAYKKALSEKLGVAASKAKIRGAPQWAPRGEIVAIEDAIRPTDRRAASDPNRRQLRGAIHVYLQKLANLLAGRARRYGNAPNWRDLMEAAAAFAEIVALAPDVLLGRLGLAYALALRLGRLLETDSQTRRTGDGDDPTFDLDVAGALTDIVRLAAPWMRGFPTVAKWDDEAARMLTRYAALEPSRDFVRNALASEAIGARDAEAIEALARAADPRTFPGQKASNRAIGGANNLLWALAEIAAAGQAGAIDPVDIARWRLARKALATLHTSKAEIAALTETASDDLRNAMSALVVAAGREDADEADADEAFAPPEDVEKRARALVLRGVAPPAQWRPYIRDLDFRKTDLVDATPLMGLAALTTLDLSGTKIADAAPLAGLAALTRLFLSGTKIADAAPLAGLTALKDLFLSNTHIADAAPFAGLPALTTLNLSNTKIANAAPLAGLTALTMLSLGNTKIAEAAPLAGLAALTTLNLGGTKIAEAAPLAGLVALTTLNLRSTKIANAAPLAGLAALTNLDLSCTEIADAGPLAGLAALTNLDLERTEIADAAPLAGLAALRFLSLSGTKITDTTPLAGLAAITELYLSGTKIVDVAPLARLAALERLDLTNTSIADISPLAGLRSLKYLDLRGTFTNTSPLAEQVARGLEIEFGPAPLRPKRAKRKK